MIHNAGPLNKSLAPNDEKETKSVEIIKGGNFWKKNIP